MSAQLLTTALAAKTLATPSGGGAKREKVTSFKEAVLNRPFFWILVAGGITFLLIKAGKNITEAFKKWQSNKDFNQEFKEKIQIKPLSYTEQQYLIYANSLYDAFVGVGTNLERVASVMSKMKSDADVLALIKAYGTRDGGTYWWSPDMTLIEQIPYDMDSSDITKYVNNPLQANGVTYRF